MGCHRKSTNNQNILLLATLASIHIAQGLTSDQIETLAAFFEVLGDNLALLIAPPCCISPISKKEDTES